MRLVVDTNVLVSAFLWQGTPGRLIKLASEKAVELFTSRTLLDELAATLIKKKLAKPVLATGLTANQMLSDGGIGPGSGHTRQPALRLF